jgi:hypothetical protein
MRLEHSFLPVEGVGETRERRLWEAGVERWDLFDPASRPRVGAGGADDGRTDRGIPA